MVYEPFQVKVTIWLELSNGELGGVI